MKKHAAPQASGTPIYCYVILIALTAVLCTYFFAKALNYNTYTIIEDGVEMKLPSDSTDPEEILSEAGITLAAGDSFSISDSGTITVVHENSADPASVSTEDGNSAADTTEASTGTANSTRYDTEIVEIPYDTITYTDPSLTEGTTMVQTEGCVGQAQVTTCTTIVNGREVSTEVVSTVTLVAPVDEVILTGSIASCNEADSAIESEAASLSESDEQTEAEPDDTADTAAETMATAESVAASAAAETVAAAEPEPEAASYEEPADEPEPEEEPEPEPEPEAEAVPAEEPEEEPVYDETPDVSGNTITTADGTVLTYSEVLSVTATAYTGGGITATGTTARYGEIAVDPSVIPYGTRLYIMTDDGSWIYGYATAEDCGGAIKGNIIDLYFDSYDTCIQFGRRSCTVYILD